MPKWECVKCGKVHRSNPEQCSNCSHTILTQHRDSPLLSNFGRPSKHREEISTNQYYCKKCGHVHEGKPFVCEDCGASTLAPYDIPPLNTDADGQLSAGEPPSFAPVVVGVVLMLILVVVFLWALL